MMNPWQQIKLTLRTLGSLIRGEALAPSDYNPVPSAVGRSDGDFLAQEASQQIKAKAVESKGSNPNGTESKETESKEKAGVS